MRKYLPLYITMGVALCAVLWWLEKDVPVVEVPNPAPVPEKKRVKTFWSFLPPVAYVIRN